MLQAPDDTASPLYVGAYWGPRPETVEGCADRLVRFLNALAGAHDLMATWFRTNPDQATAISPIRLDHESLRWLLLGGRSRRDDDRRPIDTLGYSAALWNGQQAAVGLRVGCGTSHPLLMNAVTVDLPEPQSAATVLYDLQVVRRAMIALADSWEPDWAVCVSHELAEIQHSASHEPVVGWLTYLDDGRSLPRNLPRGVKRETLAKGNLLYLSERVTDVTPQAVTELRSVLMAAGSLTQSDVT